jgi:hypothetical protein
MRQSVYSKLTIKTKAKLALVVLDGLGDLATKEQGFLTPLEAATRPIWTPWPGSARKAA